MIETKTEVVEYSNPRTEALIEDWPFGKKTCKARFEVQKHPRFGQRVARYTENKTRTGWNSPKCSTYTSKVAILDGSDGRTYIGMYHDMYDHITIMQGTMKFQAEVICKNTANYGIVKALILSADAE